MRMAGKTCLITGAARGIGLAMSQAFLAEGARVVMSDRDEAELARAAAGLGVPERTLAVPLDVTSAASIEAARAAAEEAGFAIDVLVNNAAAITIGKLLDTKADELRHLLNVNVEGLFNVTHAFLPGMIARGGGVVLNMASLAGVRAMHERFAYGATKAAIAMMTRSIAVDYVADGIRANSICPARVHTAFVEDYIARYYPGEEEERFALYSRYQPVGRMIRPDEVAAMAVYLCSDESAMVTGQTMVIDGGVTAGDQPPAAPGA